MIRLTTVALAIVGAAVALFLVAVIVLAAGRRAPAVTPPRGACSSSWPGRRRLTSSPTGTSTAAVLLQTKG
jgi:hypothetical protein